MQLVLLPRNGVVVNVLADIMQGFFVTGDVFVIVALPNLTMITSIEQSINLLGRNRFEVLNNCPNRPWFCPIWL